jgi:hypothetical protein
LPSFESEFAAGVGVAVGDGLGDGVGVGVGVAAVKVFASKLPGFVWLTIGG